VTVEAPAALPVQPGHLTSCPPCDVSQPGGGAPAASPCCVTAAPQMHRYTAHTYGNGVSTRANSTLMTQIVTHETWLTQEAR
jgi:hypothetical protein